MQKMGAGQMEQLMQVGKDMGLGRGRAREEVGGEGVWCGVM